MPKSPTRSTPDNATVNALLIYDNFASGLKARGVLQRTAYCAKAPGRWEIRPLHLDVLRVPETREGALVDAVNVDLLALAGLYTCSIPVWLMEWMERWANYRKVVDAALVVFQDGIEGADSPPTTRELSVFAARHRLHLIVPTGEDLYFKEGFQEHRIFGG
jgi:hypothetical protein